MTLADFEARVLPEPNSGCWLWNGAVTNDGRGSYYGNLMYEGRSVKAHRLSYEQARGPIPPGLELDHLCRTQTCVNPAHLEPVTHAENVRRGLAGRPNSAKVQCPKGHPYAGENLYQVGMNRQCQICRRARSLAWDRQRRDRNSGF